MISLSVYAQKTINQSIYQSIYLSQSISISASLSLSLSLSASLSLCLSLPLSFFYRKLETKKQLVLTASDQEFFDVLRMRRCLMQQKLMKVFILILSILLTLSAILCFRFKLFFTFLIQFQINLNSDDFFYLDHFVIRMT